MNTNTELITVVADDASVNRKTLAKKITSLGYSTPILVKRGEDAFKECFARKGLVDVIFMDNNFGNKSPLSGLVVAKEIINNFPGIKIVGYSSDGGNYEAKAKK